MPFHAQILPERKVVPEKIKTFFFLALAVFLMLTALLFASPQQIWQGQVTILLSPANLLTDYIAVAGAGAAFFNASIMLLHALAIVHLARAKLNGPVIAGILTVAGFAFFGKNLYNSMSIVLGAFAFARVGHQPAQKSLLAALFGTALSPLVSELSFNQGLSLPAGIFLGNAAGFLCGFLLPPLAKHVLFFTKGFSLYNIGFTSGIIGTVFISLMRNFGMEVENVEILAAGYNRPFSILLAGLFFTMILLGVYFNAWSFEGLKRMATHSGQLSTDFVELAGFGATLINMGMLGLLSTAYILVHGGELNGPVLGGIFTVVGFGAFGKHIKNVIPVFLGVSLMALFIYQQANSTAVLIAALFGTTLAPVAGRYGPAVGLIAGALHLTLVMNIGYLHAGVNLYNNGFSGGLVAAILVPLLEELHIHAQNRHAYRNPINPAEEVELEEDTAAKDGAIESEKE